jgi:dihydrofolate reductase
MEFSSLDGVTQGPGSPDEDTSDDFARGGWFVPHLDETFVQTMREWVSGADAYLFGRRTYVNFARDWPNMPDLDDPVARSLNTAPKYVASNTLSDADATWTPTTVLRGDIVAAVAQLKRLPGRELQIHGSATLGRFLLEAGVIDELRLVLAPVLVGAGRRLFGALEHAAGLRLIDVARSPLGLALLRYEIQGPARYDTYDPETHTFGGA